MLLAYAKLRHQASIRVLENHRLESRLCCPLLSERNFDIQPALRTQCTHAPEGRKVCGAQIWQVPKKIVGRTRPYEIVVHGEVKETCRTRADVLDRKYFLNRKYPRLRISVRDKFSHSTPLDLFVANDTAT
jgi:hypothetical protein